MEEDEDPLVGARVRVASELEVGGTLVDVIACWGVPGFSVCLPESPYSQMILANFKDVALSAARNCLNLTDRLPPKEYPRGLSCDVPSPGMMTVMTSAC